MTPSGTTPDCGKTSASRQTFVTGKAAELPGRALRKEIFRMTNAGQDARLTFSPGRVRVRQGSVERHITLAELPADQRGYALDPRTTPLDGNGQGEPYAGFGAHMVELEVDHDLGSVRLGKSPRRTTLARQSTTCLSRGQIEGGIAHGNGFARMEEFHPGRGENLHAYLLVTPIESILIKDASPLGPFGAEGIGATGARLRRVPATPDRVRAAIFGQ
jgi:CO/xanthine dehydrogenase Mo-binding subunit